MTNRSLLTLVGLLTVLAVGFTLGALFKSSGRLAVEAPHEVVRVVRVPEVDPRADLENSQLRRQVKDLQSRVAQGEAATANRRGPAEDEPNVPLPPPVAFPRDLPRTSMPDGFREVLAKTVESCGLGLTVAKVDCTEYPCIAWTKATDPAVRQFSMSGCAPWKQAFPQGERVVGKTVRLPDGSEERYFGWMPMPEEGSREAVMKRFQERREYAEHALGIEN